MLGIKQQQRFKDISWLMPRIDVCSVLERLGIKVEEDVRGQLWAFCPDHHMYTGRRPSDPKWAVNKKTGETYCFTESRGSNLFWTVKRLKGFESLDDTLKWIMGTDSSHELAVIKLAGVKNRVDELKKASVVNEKSKIFKFAITEEDIEKGKVFQSGYEFFMRPPEKRPTNIRKETVDRYKVIQRNWGFYVNRVIVPFFLKGGYRGFVGIDILGSKKWAELHPSSKKYTKTRYPPGFSCVDYLFGYDDVEVGADFVIVTEGVREVMKLWQEGFRNVVAVLHSGIADGQITLLSELTPKRVVLMFDGDEAGVDATERVTKKIEGLFHVMPVFLPKKTDPKVLDSKQLQSILEKSLG